MNNGIHQQYVSFGEGKWSLTSNDKKNYGLLSISVVQVFYLYQFAISQITENGTTKNSWLPRFVPKKTLYVIYPWRLPSCKPTNRFLKKCRKKAR